MEVSNGLLWQCPPVVSNIFKHLCAKDLSSCAKVCSLWSRLSIPEINRRQSIKGFLKFNISRKFEPNCKIPEGRPGDLNCDDFFPSMLTSGRARPSLCLAFITLITPGKDIKIPKFSSNSKYLKHELYVKERLRNFRDSIMSPSLPGQCQIHCFATPGTIGCRSKGWSSLPVVKTPAICGVLLPNFPGVYIQHCTIDSVEKSLSEELPGRPIKGILMFVSSHSEGLERRCLKECIKHNEGEKFMFLGTSLEPVLDGLGSCFVFSGENVEAASIVIDTTTKDIANELALFKKTRMLKNRCFAFMFSCFYKDFVPNFGKFTFNKMYPHVPLTWCFVYKNSGYHFLPNVDKDDPDHMQRCQKFPLNQCAPKDSVTFVLFSVKAPK